MRRGLFIRRIRTFLRATSGAALVEFVIVFPMMILFFAIMVEFGRLYWGYQSVVAGVRDASRYVARIADPAICSSGTSGSLAVYMTGAEIKTRLEQEYIGNTNVLPSQFVVDATNSSASFICRTETDVTYRVNPIPFATVSAEVTMQFPLGHLFALFGSSLGSVTATVRDEARIYGT